MTDIQLRDLIRIRMDILTINKAMVLLQNDLGETPNKEAAELIKIIDSWLDITAELGLAVNNKIDYEIYVVRKVGWPEVDEGN